MQTDRSNLSEVGRVYKIRREIRRLLWIAFGVLFIVGLVVLSLVQQGQMPPSPSYPNLSGLICSLIVLVECGILLALRQRVVLTRDSIKSNLFFTSKLSRDEISGWRGRFSDGHGDIWIYPKDRRKAKVVVASEIERDAALEGWIRQFPER